MEFQLIVPGAAAATSLPPANGTDYTLKECCAHLRCDMIEVVRIAPIGGVEQILIVDEEGALRGGRVYNRVASLLAGHTIVGPAILCPSSALR